MLRKPRVRASAPSPFSVYVCGRSGVRRLGVWGPGDLSPQVCAFRPKKKKEIITSLSSNLPGEQHRTARYEMSQRKQMVFVVSYTLRPPPLYVHVYYYTPLLYVYTDTTYHILLSLPFTAPCYTSLRIHSRHPIFVVFFFLRTTINHPPRCNYYRHEIIILHLYKYTIYRYISLYYRVSRSISLTPLPLNNQ